MPPIIGVLASAALSGLWGTVATALQNRYNSPKQQLKRLRQAGLPLSYMYQGKVNQQSDAPKLSLDPDLGSVEQKNLEQQERVNVAAINKMTTEDDLLELQLNEAQLANQKKLMMSGVEHPADQNNPFPWEQINLWENMDVEYQTKRAEMVIKQNEGRIREIMKVIEEDLLDENVQADTKRQALQKIKNQIALISTQEGTLNQLQSIRKIDEVINSSLGIKLESKSDAEKGLYWALMQLLSKLKL